MPVRVLRKIAALSRATGESVESIVEKGVALYEKRSKSLSTTREDKLTELISDPRKNSVYIDLMGALGRRSSAKMTVAEKKARGIAGAKGRNAKLTSEQRKAIAKAAGQARWRNERKRMSEE